MSNKYFSKEEIFKDVWAITGPANDLMYLVIGKTKALLVDTGMGIGNLKEYIEEITTLPIEIINTHGHPDHGGGNSNFSKVHINKDDISLMKEMCTEDYRREDIRKILGEENPLFKELSDNIIKNKHFNIEELNIGDIIDIGEREFEVIKIEGHTKGSICLLNSKEKIIFTGDSVVLTDVWMYLPHCSSLKVYNHSLKNLMKREEEFETIFPGHHPTPINKSALHDLIKCSDEILENAGIGEEKKTFAGEGLLHKYGTTRIIYNLNNVY